MLVKDIMDQHPVLSNSNMSVLEVRQLMSEQGIRHIPVVVDGKVLVGLITRSSLMINPDILGSLDVMDLAHYVSQLKVEKVMIKAEDVAFTEPSQPIELAAKHMLDKKVGCLPVMEGMVVAGLVTTEDLLARLTEMMTANVHAVRATLTMPMKKGEMAKLVNAISNAGWGIIASGGGLHHRYPGKWLEVVKIRNVPLEQVKKVLSEVDGQELIDIRQM